MIGAKKPFHSEQTVGGNGSAFAVPVQTKKSTEIAVRIIVFINRFPSEFEGADAPGKFSGSLEF